MLVNKQIPILTIAGSDPIGGAGVQGDLKTFMAHNLYGMSVITALTVQDTKGVYRVSEINDNLFEQQLEKVFEDIKPRAVKIGLLPNSKIVEIVSRLLKKYECSKIVLDTVFSASSGREFSNLETRESIKSELLPLADIITPNLKEVGVLTEMTVDSKEAMEIAGKKIRTIYDGAILIKGGHLRESCDDLLFIGDEKVWIDAERLKIESPHGTGCALSSAIASNLAYGLDILESVLEAKKYITASIKSAFTLGNGQPLLNHNIDISRK